MTENFAVQTLTQADDGVFGRNLKMPLLNTLGQPGRRPGDFGLFSNTVYVRLADQSVIALGTSTPQTWAQTLALGNVSGPNTPIITTGQSIQFQDGVQIGASSSSASATGDAVAIGALVTASGPGAIALGSQAGATGLSSVAVSSSATASSPFALAIGSGSLASGTRSAAFGANASSTFLNSTALGTYAIATKNNQVMIGNFPSGGTNEVFFSLGDGGVAWSSGFFRAEFCVQVRKTASGAQVIAGASPQTAIAFPSVNYTADYGTPAIDSVGDRIFLRTDYSLSGLVNFNCGFAPALASGITLVASVLQDDGINPPAVVGSSSIVLAGGLGGFSFVVPFKVTPVAADRTIFVTINNPSGSAMTILSLTSFTGTYDN